MFLKHPILSVLTLGYLGLVGWITLGPQPLDTHGDAWLWSLLRFFGRHDATSWLTYQRVEFLANVAMFVPVGMFFLLLLGRRLWFVSVLLGVALTTLIEFAQLFIPGRVSDVSDIVANSLGSLVGVLVALVVTAVSAGRTQRLRTRSSA
jgi:glycopeptide antibiotics resistance protein